MNDLAAIHELHSLPETDQYNALGIPDTMEETHSIITPWIAMNQADPITKYTLAIESKLDNAFLGLFGLNLGSKKPPSRYEPLSIMDLARLIYIG